MDAHDPGKRADHLQPGAITRTRAGDADNDDRQNSCCRMFPCSSKTAPHLSRTHVGASLSRAVARCELFTYWPPRIVSARTSSASSTRPNAAAFRHDRTALFHKKRFADESDFTVAESSGCSSSPAPVPEQACCVRISGTPALKYFPIC